MVDEEEKISETVAALVAVDEPAAENRTGDTPQ